MRFKDNIRSEVLKTLMVFIGIASLLLLASIANAADVCGAYEFEGMHSNKLRAESVLPPDTTSFKDKAKLYVEYDKGVLYYHSNFLVEGNKYPTKVKGDSKERPEFADPAYAFANVVLAFRETPPPSKEIKKVEQEFKKNVELLIDTTIFDEAGVPRIDLTGVRNYRVVDAAKIHGVLPESTEIITTSKPPPSIISKIKGCCLYGRPPHLVGGLSEKLSNKKFNSNDVKVASLFIDSGTEKEIMKTSKVRSARLKGDSKSLRSEEDLRKLFKEANGSTLILLGHVEGENYVIRTSKNVEQLKVSISKVREIARENDVVLIDIGCETTKSIKEQQIGFGVMTKYNSVDAVKSLGIALTKSKTYLDFLENLSSKNLKIVLEPSFAEQRLTRATIYARIRDAGRTIWIKIAQITFTFLT